MFGSAALFYQPDSEKDPALTDNPRDPSNECSMKGMEP